MASAAASRDGLSRGPGSTDRINISDSDSDSEHESYIMMLPAAAISPTRAKGTDSASASR